MVNVVTAGRFKGKKIKAGTEMNIPLSKHHLSGEMEINVPGSGNHLKSA